MPAHHCKFLVPIGIHKVKGNDCDLVACLSAQVGHRGARQKVATINDWACDFPLAAVTISDGASKACGNDSAAGVCTTTVGDSDRAATSRMQQQNA